MNKKRLQVFAFASSFTVFTMAAFAGLGYLLDQLFGTGRLFFVIGLVIAFPAIQYSLYRKYKAK